MIIENFLPKGFTPEGLDAIGTKVLLPGREKHGATAAYDPDAELLILFILIRVDGPSAKACHCHDEIAW